MRSSCIEDPVLHQAQRHGCTDVVQDCVSLRSTIHVAVLAAAHGLVSLRDPCTYSMERHKQNVESWFLLEEWRAHLFMSLQ